MREPASPVASLAASNGGATPGAGDWQGIFRGPVDDGGSLPVRLHHLESITQRQSRARHRRRARHRPGDCGGARSLRRGRGFLRYLRSRTGRGHIIGNSSDGAVGAVLPHECRGPAGCGESVHGSSPEFGRLDILVNNAAITSASRSWTSTWQTSRKCGTSPCGVFSIAVNWPRGRWSSRVADRSS